MYSCAALKTVWMQMLLLYRPDLLFIYTCIFKTYCIWKLGKTCHHFASLKIWWTWSNILGKFLYIYWFTSGTWFYLNFTFYVPIKTIIRFIWTLSPSSSTCYSCCGSIIIFFTGYTWCLLLLLLYYWIIPLTNPAFTEIYIC